MGIDFRPATGQLFGFGVNGTGQGTIYRIDPQTGAATVVGQPAFVDAGNNPLGFPDPSAFGYGFDFNPTVDRIRVVTSTGLNFRINPDTGLGVDGGAATGTQPDGNINGDSTGVSGAAYTNNFGQSLSGGTTTLYTLDAIGDTLFIQNPANAGTNGTGLPITMGVGAFNFTDVNGFDIPAGVRVTTSGSAASGFAYAVLTVGSTTGLYRIDLATGAATALGNVGAGSTPLSGFTLADAPAGAVSFTGTSFSGNEGTTAALTLTRTGGSSGAISVTVNITSGTADPADIGVDGPYTVTFADGATSATLNIPLVTDANGSEGPENLVFELASPTNASVLGATTTATLTINDVPPPPPPPPPPMSPPPAMGGGGAFGVGATVKLANGTTMTPFTGFLGEVRTASGDVTGDGIADIIVGTGPGASHVKVLDGATGAEVRSFFAYNPLFSGGVFVAAGDVNGDGKADIIVGAGAGATPHVKVFDGLTGAELHSFFAYNENFLGGVTVAGGDVNGDGKADIITGTGPGASPHVKVFDGLTLAEVRSFFAYAPNFTGGVFVAAGDINRDGKADIITGSGNFGSHVKVFDGATPVELASFLAFPGSTVGVHVGARDVNGDGFAEILAGAGPGAQPHVKAFNGLTLALVDSFFALDGLISSGVYVS